MHKQEKIVSMFDDIANTYDITNRVLSMGVDKSWRNKACNLAFKYYNKDNISNIVDVACGTGDMINYWEKTSLNKNISIKEIIGIDPSFGMLEVAKKKLPHINFIQSGATDLTLQSNSVDILSISYGIRNVVQRQKAFDEFARVLKPNGLLIILEFTKNKKETPLDYITDFYMNKILPILGGLISKNKEAYNYLPNSIDEFLTTDSLKKELQEADLNPIYVKGFSMNISTLFIARKIS